MASSSKPWEQPSTQEGPTQPSLCRICNRCSLCRICNSTLIIIRICNPLCSYHSHYYITTTSNKPFSFVVSETERIIVLQIANPYNSFRQITNLTKQKSAATEVFLNLHLMDSRRLLPLGGRGRGAGGGYSTTSFWVLEPWGVVRVRK